MTQQTSPFLEAKYGWNFGESGWNTGMDENLVKFSFMFEGNIDAIVASLPAAVNGKAYFLSTDNRLYFVANSTYYSSPTPLWKTLTDRSTGNTYRFNGSNLVPLEGNESLSERVDAIEIELTAMGSASQLAEDLADGVSTGKGGNLVAYSSSVTVTEKLDNIPFNAVTDFNCDNTGATNCTVNMKAFFDACIATGRAGHIPGGSYLITSGQLSFDNGHVDTAWPEITTDGHYLVKFLRADDTDGAFITWTNGEAVSGVGRYWQGGSLGGITFLQNGKTRTRQQHALSMRGVQGMTLGWMRADDIGGSLIYCPEKLFSTTNPDPYAVVFCEFTGIEANRVGGMGIENRNYLGLNLCTVGVLRCIQTGEGGWFGIGAGNKVDLVSMVSVRGWAFDDGTFVAATGGPSSRFKIGLAEIDNPEYGIRLNRTIDFEYGQLRFIHRQGFDINTSTLFWPRVAFDMGTGTSPAVGHVRGYAQHRLEGGGSASNLGVFIRGNGAGQFFDYDMNNRILDNGGYGITDARLFENIGSLDYGILRRDDKPITDTRVKVAALVRSTTSDTVPSSGFGTSSSKLNFATKIYDRGNYYDTANAWYTVPYTGIYQVSGQIALTVAAGTRVRLGIGADVSGTVTVIKASTFYASTANVQHYSISGIVDLTAGQRIFLMGDQNTGAAVAMSAPWSAVADITWSISAI